MRNKHITSMTKPMQCYTDYITFSIFQCAPWERVTLSIYFKSQSHCSHLLTLSYERLSSQDNFYRQSSWNIIFAAIKTGLGSPYGSNNIAIVFRIPRFVTNFDWVCATFPKSILAYIAIALKLLASLSFVHFHSFTHSFNHSFIQSFVHSIIHSFLFIFCCISGVQNDLLVLR